MKKVFGFLLCGLWILSCDPVSLNSERTLIAQYGMSVIPCGGENHIVYTLYSDGQMTYSSPDADSLAIKKKVLDSTQVKIVSDRIKAINLDSLLILCQPLPQGEICVKTADCRVSIYLTLGTKQYNSPDRCYQGCDAYSNGLVTVYAVLDSVRNSL